MSRRRGRAKGPETALEALDRVLREERDASEALFEASERAFRERQRQYRMDVMATWDEAKVRRLAEAGRLSTDDVELWVEARRDLERRAALKLGILLFGR